MQHYPSRRKLPPMLLPQLPKKRKTTPQSKLIPWWHYLIVVILTMPVIFFAWAFIDIGFHLPFVRGEGWIKLPVMLLDLLAWSIFLAFNRSEKALRDYFPASLLVLYGSIFVMLLLFP